MKLRYRFVRLVGFVTVLGLPATVTLATEPGHHHHEPGGALRLQLNNGQQWPTDEALRQGMVNIRNVVTPNLPAIEGDKLDAAGYDQLAGKINTQVAYIIQNCHLAKEADAMLHLVLANILAGTDGMADKDKAVSRQGGALKVVQALEEYVKYFNHPGW